MHASLSEKFKELIIMIQQEYRVLNLQEELEKQYDSFSMNCPYYLTRKYQFIKKNGAKVLMIVELYKKLKIFTDVIGTKKIENWAYITIDPPCLPISKSVSNFFSIKEFIRIKINGLRVNNASLSNTHLKYDRLIINIMKFIIE